MKVNTEKTKYIHIGGANNIFKLKFGGQISV